jgi:beta-lactamase regulating signal transducer with metallopeptidase domain
MVITPFVFALGWSLIHSLWQGALLCGIAYVLLSVFYLSSKEKANLLFTLLCLLLVAFIGTFISYLPDLTQIETGNNGNIFSNESITEITDSESPFSLEAYFPHIAGVYMIGLIFQLVALFYGYLRIIQLKKGPREAVSAEWLYIFNALLREFSIKRKVGFYLSEKVQIPTVIGYFKPIILFPLAAVTALDIKQVESILIHEITHIRRHDYAINLIKCLIEALLFFNPFVWFLGRLLEKEREHSCDDQVLETTGNALVYARALLILESIRSKKLPVFALGAFGNKEYLLDRIKRITLMKTTTFHTRHKLAAMTFLIAGAIGLAWTGPKLHPSNDTLSKSVKVKPLSQEIPPIPEAPTAPKVDDLAPLAPLAPAAPLAPLAPLPKLDTLEELGATESVAKLFSSPEWKALQLEIETNGKEIGETVAKQFETPEWKTFQKELGENATEMAQLSTTELFNSPEWKAAMKDVQEHAQGMGLQAIGGHDSTYFKTPEWKVKEKEMEEKSKKLEELSKRIEEKMNAPEVKAKREALERKSRELSKRAEVFQKQFESPEFKAKQEALVKKAAALAQRSEEFRIKAEAEFKAKSDQKK